MQAAETGSGKTGVSHALCQLRFLRSTILELWTSNIRFLLVFGSSSVLHLASLLMFPRLLRYQFFK